MIKVAGHMVDWPRLPEGATISECQWVLLEQVLHCELQKYDPTDERYGALLVASSLCADEMIVTSDRLGLTPLARERLEAGNRPTTRASSLRHDRIDFDLLTADPVRWAVEFLAQFRGKCEHCEKEFHRRNRVTRYCSLECKRDSEKEWRRCAECEAEFRCGRRRDTRTCSRACGARHANRTGPKVQVECRGCGQSFDCPTHKPDQKYCSGACWERQRLKRRNLYLNNWNRLRNEKIRERGCEKIDPAKVFERDGWRCWLCGVIVMRDEVHPDSMAPTIDHVVPISKGGTHTMGNVRCAHSICNTRRGNRTVDGVEPRGVASNADAEEEFSPAHCGQDVSEGSSRPEAGGVSE